MSNRVAAVVVTFNRRELLLSCIKAIQNQVKPCDVIFIIDNCSDDGTPELLKNNNIISRLPKFLSNVNEEIIEVITDENSLETKIVYVRKFENDGGAGGFYYGMKIAYESGYDWLWFMDDDGIPDKYQLFNLLEASKKFSLDYANALVINNRDSDLLAFGLKNYLKIKEIKEKDIIYNEANPFNGTLISRNVVKDLGYIKKEMFIWGDESDYLMRARKSNFTIATVINAVHRHPENKGVSEPIFPLIQRPSVTIKPENLAHIYFRNTAYLNIEYGSVKQVFSLFIRYFLYYVFRLKLVRMFEFIKAFHKGIKRDFR